MKDQNDRQDITPVDAETKEATRKDKKLDSRRSVIWTIASVYLLYLTYQLIKGMINGEAESTATMIISVVGCILFVGMSIYLMVQVVRGSRASFKQSLADMEEADRILAEEEAERRALEEAEDDWDDDPAEDEEDA